MVESPTIIVDLLATSLPQQATYFMQITFVSTVISGGMELLRVVPVAMAIIRSFIGPRLTEDEKRTTFLGIRPLYDPKDFEHADFTSNAVRLPSENHRFCSIDALIFDSALVFCTGFLFYGAPRLLSYFTIDELHHGILLSRPGNHAAPSVSFHLSDSAR